MTPNSFKDAIQSQTTRTDNGMLAYQQTKNACVDLFFKAGSMRDADVVPTFAKALAENNDIATRIAAWLRDVRGGAGERETFRNILRFLEKTNPIIAMQFIPHIPEIGRWDDLLVFSDGSSCQASAFEFIKEALNNGNGLAAKWMPREKSANKHMAVKLRQFLNLDSKTYRKKLATLSSTVEDHMCAKEWDNIEYSHVPSIAHAKYKQAFIRNDKERYDSYISKVLAGDSSVKINAQAIFPHDVIRGYIHKFITKDQLQDENNIAIKTIKAQWDALPDYVNDANTLVPANILPIVDVSGSMEAPIQFGNALTCLEVAVSLGLYLSEKNTGKFKDICVTFSREPELLHLTGDIVSRMFQLSNASWGMNTDLELTMKRILTTALEHNVPKSEMPEYLLILSDMNFDMCVDNFDNTAFDMIKTLYENSGYNMPNVIFWNINAKKHVPVRFDEVGTALVSGYSPSILSAILSDNMEKLTPESIMLEAVMKPRYDILQLT